jgi:uncharacterized protein
MKLQRLCAYNQSRECFLGLEVAVVDFSCEDLSKLLEKLLLKPGEGVWIVPFKGISETNTTLPLDLIYLDQNYRVIDLVESFPTTYATSSNPQIASVLGLPIHSIFSSQTQIGDQLVLCSAEEMQHKLKRPSDFADAAGTVWSAALLRKKPLWSDGPGVVNIENSTSEALSPSSQPYEMDLIEPKMKKFLLPKDWLKRWWSPDPRKAPRKLSPNIAAYYWTGSTPKAHTVRDISSSGIYVITEERWYPGTLVLMTLQEIGNEKQSVEHSIAVLSRAVRWGEDGVGLQFVPCDSHGKSGGSGSQEDGVTKKQLEQFLQRLQGR